MFVASFVPKWLASWMPAYRWRATAAPGVLIVAGVLAYANSFSVPMLLDDDQAIADNPSIRDLRELDQVLWPARTATTGGRPLLNLSFALNYASSQLEVRAYHATNLAIHLVAGLLFFALVRRTLLRPNIDPQLSRRATAIALAAAATWLLHPLHTSAVTYISQRAESLMGLWYLATLYCFSRSLGAKYPWRWQFACILSCLGGMATKEVMVTAPIMVLLYDRAFATDSFQSLFALRRRYYAALASSWVLLAALMAGSRVSQRNIGFDQGVSAWTYVCTQAKVIAGYLSLACWPHPLVFDYGSEYVAQGPGEFWAAALVVIGALVMAFILWGKSPARGFLAVAFFILLAPTSSVVPVAQQPMAESRMYLPLAAIAAGAACLAWRTLQERALLGGAALALALGTLTFARNAVLGDPLALWESTLLGVPGNSRAHDHAAIAFDLAGRPDQAGYHFQEAIRLNPRVVLARVNYAQLLGKIGRRDDAIRLNEEAIRLSPAYTRARRNLAHLLAQDPKRLPEALAHYQEAARQDPSNFDGHSGYVHVLAKLGRFDEARSYGEAILARNPRLVALRRALADAYAVNARPEDAIALYRSIIASQPPDAEVFYNLGVLLHIQGKLEEALANYEQTLALNPRHFGALNNKGMVWGKSGRVADAIRCFEAALAINPNFQPARDNVILYRAKLGLSPAGNP